MVPEADPLDHLAKATTPIRPKNEDPKSLTHEQYVLAEKEERLISQSLLETYAPQCDGYKHLVSALANMKISGHAPEGFRIIQSAVSSSYTFAGYNFFKANAGYISMTIAPIKTEAGAGAEAPLPPSA
jgi:hypothetical protein